jgi:hypothetical protein
VIALMLALALLPPSVRPWPIGAAPRYRPAAAVPAVRAAKPVGSHRCGPHATRFSVHVELFANRRAVVIPAGIGVAALDRRVGEDIRPRGCVYGVHTTAPMGVIRVAGGVTTLGDLFRIWGQALGPHALLSFRSHARVNAFLGGKKLTGDPRRIRLTRHAQIVLEIGGFVPPHPSYLFPKGTP